MAGTDSRVSRWKKRPTNCEGCRGDSVNRYSRNSRCCCPQHDSSDAVLHARNHIAGGSIRPRGWYLGNTSRPPNSVRIVSTSGGVFCSCACGYCACRVCITPAPAVYAAPPRGVHCACARSARSISTRSWSTSLLCLWFLVPCWCLIDACVCACRTCLWCVLTLAALGATLVVWFPSWVGYLWCRYPQSRRTFLPPCGSPSSVDHGGG